MANEHILSDLTEFAAYRKGASGLEITLFQLSSYFFEKLSGEGVEVSQMVKDAFGIRPDLLWSVVQEKGKQSLFAFGVTPDTEQTLDNTIATLAVDNFLTGSFPSVRIAGVNPLGKETEKDKRSVIVAGTYGIQNDSLLLFSVGIDSIQKDFPLHSSLGWEHDITGYQTNPDITSIPTDVCEPIARTAGFITRAMVEATKNETTLLGQKKSTNNEFEVGKPTWLHNHKLTASITDSEVIMTCTPRKPKYIWTVRFPLHLSK